jgi:hypothetical protein
VRERTRKSNHVTLAIIVTACLLVFLGVLLLLSLGLRSDQATSRPSPVVAQRNRPLRRPPSEPLRERRTSDSKTIARPRQPRDRDAAEWAPPIGSAHDSSTTSDPAAEAIGGDLGAAERPTAPKEIGELPEFPDPAPDELPDFAGLPSEEEPDAMDPKREGTEPGDKSVPGQLSAPSPADGEEAKPPAQGPAGPTDEEVAALAASLKDARTAISEQRWEQAIATLEDAQALPKQPEHQAKYDRLYLLAHYARDFQSALKEAIAALESGDEIEVGSSTVVGVVDTSGDRITLRVRGTNLKYDAEDLPAGLAVAIADTWLDQDDPVSLVLKGAYLATLPDAREDRLAKAREFWQQAADQGIAEVGDLHQVIGDTYDLQ